VNFIFLGVQEQEVWKGFIPAIGPIVAALITTIGVIWTARSSLKKLKIDQKATPTELTRYKEWLEVAEKYKSIYMTQDPNGPDYGRQWNNIRKSCEAALQAASWERIVLSEIPEGRAQKKLLNLDSNYVASMLMEDNNHNKKVPKFRNHVYNIIYTIIIIFFILFSFSSILLSVVKYFQGSSEWIAYLFTALSILFYISLTEGMFYSITGEVLAEVYFRKVAYSNKIQLDEPEDIDRRKRIKAIFWDPELENYVIFPKKRGFRRFIYRFWVSFYTSSKILKKKKYGYAYFEKPEYSNENNI
jgi:hypothetical protein